MKLLRQVAEDLSFGLKNIENVALKDLFCISQVK